MAAKKILKSASGQYTEYQGVVTSAGAGNSGDYPALDAAGKLDSSVMPTGIGADTLVCAATENLAAGAFVNLFLSSSVIKARNSDATAAGKEVWGFVLAAVTSGNNATVYRMGENTSLAGLTIGSVYFMDKTTPGGVTSDVSAFSGGNVIQELGIATAATTLDFVKTRTLVTA